MRGQALGCSLWGNQMKLSGAQIKVRWLGSGTLPSSVQVHKTEWSAALRSRSLAYLYRSPRPGEVGFASTITTASARQRRLAVVMCLQQAKAGPFSLPFLLASTADFSFTQLRNSAEASTDGAWPSRSSRGGRVAHAQEGAAGFSHRNDAI
jgi:hypothetical protein